MLVLLTADLDNVVFNYCIDNKIQWLFKSSNDVIIEESFLNKEIPEVDFYYLIGISYEDLYLNNFDYRKINIKDFLRVYNNALNNKKSKENLSNEIIKINFL